MIPPTVAAPPRFTVSRRRLRLLGLTADDGIRWFFGGNALIAVIVLTLITLFLFREGAGFFGQNRSNLEIYRRAGLEYVDFIRAQTDDHTALTRYLSDLRVRWMTWLLEQERHSLEEANARLEDFDRFADRFAGAVDPLRELMSGLADHASGIKAKYQLTQDRRVEQAQLAAAGRTAEAAGIEISAIDFERELEPLRESLPTYRQLSRDLAGELTALLAEAPAPPTPALRQRMDRFAELTREYVAGFPAVEHRLETWDSAQPVPAHRAFTSFLFGRQWLTASSWQDWYGIVPLFVGSLLVAALALLLAVPLGVGAAIYVSQLASSREQRLIKPCIEFISAIPSVVLGFFGIVILGETLRQLSQVSWLSWLPGFPYSERLNILTAGSLLALVAVPTIFTLAEDALNNVPRGFKEASLALGASQLQTVLKIIVPASLSGIVSAVLLGFGRVIGETMIVLLCAGNRIEIPDFTRGVAVVTEPVHTMTGIIAQEMGEVVRDSIHYRALFMVGLVLFLLALVINYAAQKIMRRYRLSTG